MSSSRSSSLRPPRPLKASRSLAAERERRQLQSQLQRQVLDVSERTQRVEVYVREDQVDKAVRQLLIYGWGAETKNQRKAC
eukprot:2151795-Alexandrium_andersonii.AAC.1